MEKARPPNEQMNKRQYKAFLLDKIKGKTAEQAAEILTAQQWDFLIDCDVNLDTLTADQQKAVAEIRRAERPKGLQYKKNYPKAKQDLFKGLVEFVKSRNGEVVQPVKMNYRDLEFTLDGKQYKIVLSEPRAKKL